MVKLLRTDLAFVRFIAGMFCQVLLKCKKAVFVMENYFQSFRCTHMLNGCDHCLIAYIESENPTCMHKGADGLVFGLEKGKNG